MSSNGRGLLDSTNNGEGQLKLAERYIATSLVLCLAIRVVPAAATNVSFSHYEFEASNGTKVEAEKGTFLVPENRSDPNTRQIEIGFVRFRSTSENPGAPIVYLAGGPGGTGVGTARRWRFPLFMAMREF